MSPPPRAPNSLVLDGDQPDATHIESRVALAQMTVSHNHFSDNELFSGQLLSADGLRDSKRSRPGTVPASLDAPTPGVLSLQICNSGAMGLPRAAAVLNCSTVGTCVM
jgi:hypothetical protein